MSEIAAFMTCSADGRIAYGVWKAPSYAEVIKARQQRRLATFSEAEPRSVPWEQRARASLTIALCY